MNRAAPLPWIWLVAAACGAAGCGGGAAAPQLPAAASAQFEGERARAIQRELVALGPRPAGSDALEQARQWAAALESSARASPNEMRVVLLAPLSTRDDERGLEASSAAIAAAAEAARALVAGGAPVALALEDDLALPFETQLTNSPLVISIPRGCGIPERRDLLSHRVLRERFFRIARGSEAAPAFVEADAGQRDVIAAGGLRVVALDAPSREGRCDAAALGPALVAFVRDAVSLLARHGMNSDEIATSHARPEAPRAPQRSSP
ncbi:MAG TPA: hypothetical protein VFT98_18435 [Myxococcota bacterium]|nr:hypothetical protein [Myxococcota bacterium]